MASELPIFVNPLNSTGVAPALMYHCTAHDLSYRLRKTFTVLNVKSERTGRAVDVSSRRFRYTRGTRAAMDGASELVIAELLDHTDTQNVGVYTKYVPEIVERIDRAMAMHLAPLAQAFVGQLIQMEDQALRRKDPTSRIVGPDDLDHPLGNCGHFGFCGALAPIACYTCRNFQPWIDGPHDLVLNSLLVEREMVLRNGGSLTIASINDRTILACAEVVQKCSVLRNRLEE